MPFVVALDSMSADEGRGNAIDLRQKSQHCSAGKSKKKQPWLSESPESWSLWIF